ncbi:MAG: cation:proton antiporter [Lentisphaeraceae bacterium]|nr:cation:proton antiporter [Lentisphaeraceae bacterium]
MNAITHEEIIIFFFSLALLIGVARALGEVARKLGQPSILGEIATGVLLGPTFFGYLAPEFQAKLFPSSGPLYVTFELIGLLAISLFMLIAGMEIDLKCLKKQGKEACSVGFMSMLVPFASGFCLIYFFPAYFNAEEKTLITALFLGTAMAISALPVITKILMDLKLFKSDMGITVIAAAVFNDLVGWLIFAVVLGMMSNETSASPVTTIGWALGLTVFALTLGRTIICKMIPWVQAHTSWPGGVMGFTLCGALTSAGIAELIGIHGIFGCFLFGIALGDSRHLRHTTIDHLEKFIAFILTPIFFATIGLKVNFLTHFDVGMVAIFLFVGSTAKVAGSYWGARLCKFDSKESLAIGYAMNARGVMEIILGLIALEAGVINDTLFVALVVLALFTSMTSGTLMKKALHRPTKISTAGAFSRGSFVADLEGEESSAVIGELVKSLNWKPQKMAVLLEEVLKREGIQSTGLEKGLAIPHCRTGLVEKPLLAIGVHRNGVDFNCFDDKKAHLVIMIITPLDEPGTQLDLISTLASHLSKDGELIKALDCKTKIEMLALLNTADELVPDVHAVVVKA